MTVLRRRKKKLSSRKARRKTDPKNLLIDKLFARTGQKLNAKPCFSPEFPVNS